MGYRQNMGSKNKYIGLVKPKDLINLNKQVTAAILRLERDIANATKGIDPNDTKSVNFAISQVMARYKGEGGYQTRDQKILNIRSGDKHLPPEIQVLVRALRSAPTAKSRGLNILSRVMAPGLIDKNNLNQGTLSGTRDFTGKWHSSQIAADPMGFLNWMYGIQRTINDVQGTRYSQDIAPETLAEYGIKLDLSQPNNIYYNKNRDLITKGPELNDYYGGRDKFIRENPNIFLSNPGSYRATLNENSPYYRANAKGEPYSPLNTLKTKPGEYQGNWREGATRWTDRSKRGPNQANADTRALLIKKGASPNIVNRLSNDVLSRFRISGALSETGDNMRLINDRGSSLNIRLNSKGKNNQEYLGSEYSQGYDNNSEVKSSVAPGSYNSAVEKPEPTIDKRGVNKNVLNIGPTDRENMGNNLSIGDRLRNFERKLSNSFSDPL